MDSETEKAPASVILRASSLGLSSGCSEGWRGLGALAWRDVHSPQVEERTADLCR